MKWLIIGTGWISESFIEALRSNGETPYGIYSRTKEKGEAFAKKNNIEKVLTSLDELDEYEAAYIGTPNKIHYEQAKTLINKGIDLMIEKPMSHSYALTKELYDLADSKNVKIMEAYVHITHKEIRSLKGKEMKTNFMQLSSKMKNGTYATASSFSKELFGGVIPDIGVYPISLSIANLGNVKSFELSNQEMLNGVIISCHIKLILERGTSEFNISKVEDGDNAVYMDGIKVMDKVSGYPKDGMWAEVKEFVNNNNLNFYRSVSIETARVVEDLLK